MMILDRVVVITGGGSGIGAALARRCANSGGRVCVADRDYSKAQEIASEIGGLAVACDVTDESQILALIAKAEEAIGSIDIFVSNAGLGRGDPTHVASAPDADWMLNWQVHVMAHVYAARALLPGMIERGGGYFVNVASAAGLLSQIGDAAYSASKHAAVSFAESMAISHGHEGIGVSVVCPQYVATPLIGLSDADAAERDSLLTADDVAVSILDAVAANQVLVLPHPTVQEYTVLRAQDHQRWISGMQKLRAKAVRETGTLRVQDFYKLI